MAVPGDVEREFAMAQEKYDSTLQTAAELLLDNGTVYLNKDMPRNAERDHHPWAYILRVLMLLAEGVQQPPGKEWPEALLTVDGIASLFRQRGKGMAPSDALTVLKQSLSTCNTAQRASFVPFRLALNASLARAADVFILRRDILTLTPVTPEEFEYLCPLVIDDNTLSRAFNRDPVKVPGQRKYEERVVSTRWAQLAANHLLDEGGAALCSAIEDVHNAKVDLDIAVEARSFAVAAALRESDFLGTFTQYPSLVEALQPLLPGFSVRSVSPAEATGSVEVFKFPSLAEAVLVFSSVSEGGVLRHVYLGKHAKVCAVVEDGQAMLEPLLQAYVQHSYNLLVDCGANKPPLLPTRRHLLKFDHLILLLVALNDYGTCAGVAVDTLGLYGERYLARPSMEDFLDVETKLGGQVPVIGTRIGYVLPRAEVCPEGLCGCSCHGPGTSIGCVSCSPARVTVVEHQTVAARPGRTLPGRHVRAGNCTYKIYGPSGEPKAKWALRCDACAALATRCGNSNKRRAAAVAAAEEEASGVGYGSEDEEVAGVGAPDPTPAPPKAFDYATALDTALKGSVAEMTSVIRRLVAHSQAVELRAEELEQLSKHLRVEMADMLSLKDPDSDLLCELLLSEAFMKKVWALPDEELGIDDADAVLSRNKKRLLVLMCQEAAGKKISGNRGNSWHPELITFFQHIKAVSGAAFNELSKFLPTASDTTINRATTSVTSKGGADPQKVQQARVKLKCSGLNPDGMIMALSMDVMHVKKGIYVDSSGFVVGTRADVGKFVLFPSAREAAPPPPADPDASAAAAPADPAEADADSDMEGEGVEHEEGVAGKVAGGEGGGVKRGLKDGEDGGGKKRARRGTKKTGGVVDTLAGSVLIVMARSIAHARLYFEIACYPIGTEDHEVIMEAERECRELLVGAGFRVKALCFDAGSGNRKAAAILTRVLNDPDDPEAQEQLKRGITPSYFVCPLQDTKVYILYDPDHLLKRLVMAVFNSGARTSKIGAEKTTYRAMLYDPWGVPVSFEHILLTHRVDMLAHGTLSKTFMTARAVLKRGADKMRVDHAQQVTCLATCSFALEVGRAPWDAYIEDNVGGGRPKLAPCPPAWRAARSKCMEMDAAAMAAEDAGGGGGSPRGAGGAGSSGSIKSTQVPEAKRVNPHRATVRTLHCGGVIFGALYRGAWLTAADAEGPRLKRAEEAARFLDAWAAEGSRNKGFLDKAVGADALSSILAMRGLLREVGEEAAAGGGGGGGGAPAAARVKVWGRTLSTTDLEHHIGAVRGSRGYHTITGNNPTVAEVNRMSAVLFSEDLAKATRLSDRQATVAGRNVVGTEGALLLSLDLGLGKEEALAEEKNRVLALEAVALGEERTPPGAALRVSYSNGVNTYFTASNEAVAGNQVSLTVLLKMPPIEPQPSSFTGRFFERAGITADPARSTVPAVHPDATAARVKVRTNRPLLGRVRDALARPNFQHPERVAPPAVALTPGGAPVSADEFPGDFPMDAPLPTDADRPNLRRFTGNFLGTLFVKAVNAALQPHLNKSTFLRVRGAFADFLHRSIIEDAEVQRLMAVAAQLNPAVEEEDWQLYELRWLLGWWFVLAAMKRFRLRAIDFLLEEDKSRNPKQAGNFRAVVAVLSISSAN